MNHEGKANRRFQRAVQARKHARQKCCHSTICGKLRSVRLAKSESAVIAARENDANLRNAQQFCRRIAGPDEWAEQVAR